MLAIQFYQLRPYGSNGKIFYLFLLRHQTIFLIAVTIIDAVYLER